MRGVFVWWFGLVLIWFAYMGRVCRVDVRAAYEYAECVNVIMQKALTCKSESSKVEFMH